MAGCRQRSSVGPCTSSRLALVMGAFVLGGVRGEVMSSHTFAAPFNEVATDGKRLLHKEWTVSGSSAVNQNFARITPDRQSRKGALWSTKPLEVEQFTATLKFRIHGQGKKFFGDGLAFWIMQQPYWQEGELHAVSPTFTGVGVVFDTFKNTEHGAKHRDVAVYVNDGKKSQADLSADFEGCDANVRYHGERADFGVTNATKAKFTLEGNVFTVMVDARANGNWFTCTRMELDLPEGWAKSAYFGITASTGQLADNHDVVSLHTFNDLDLHPEVDDLITTPKFGRGENMTAEERVERTEDMLAKVIDMIDILQAHGEHQLVAVQDHITNTIRKLQHQEDKSEQRIAKLEEELRGTLEDRVKNLEQTIQSSMAHRVAAMENTIQSRVQNVMKVQSGWRWPFFVLLGILIVCMGILYRWYNRLLKSHIL